MKKVEKILRVVLCFLMLLSTVSLNVTNVNATNYSLSNDGNFFIRFKSSNPNANWNTSSGIWTLGGEKVFCLEYDIATEVGNSYVPTDEYTTYSASKKKYVNYIAYFGYGYKGD
ncbi:MAG: thioester domain-containing protein, partial [Coprobacillus cateniformis]|nr:thioester domain-containing protein [Coprobacillus cateniformis]